MLEARRHSPDGRVAVAGVLIWAHPAVPDRGRSLAELFRRRTEVGLDRSIRRTPRRTAPTSSTTRSPPPLVPGCSSACSPVPPEQGAAKELAFERGSRAGHLAGARRVRARPERRGAARSSASRSSPRSLWLAMRAPVGAVPRAPAAVLAGHVLPARCSARSPARAGVLALAGILLTMAGVWLWRQRLPRRWYGAGAGRRAAAGLALSDQQPGAGHHPAGRRRVRSDSGSPGS